MKNRILLALLLVVGAVYPFLVFAPLACQSARDGAQAQVDHSEVLNTASPDEPSFAPPSDFATEAVAKNLFLRASDSNKRLANVTLEGTSYTGPIVVSSGAETLSNIVYYDWSLSCDYAAGDNTRWGALLYNEVNCKYIKWRVEGIKGEHAIYQHSPRGAVLLSDVHCFDIGAQGFQQVWRGSETSDPLGWQVTGLHRLEHCSFKQCGQPRGYGRASYAVSMFGRQAWDGSSPREAWDCPVELEDVTIEHDSHGQYELRGALLVEWRPSLRVTNSRTVYIGTSDRDFWHIHNVKTVYVSNTYAFGPAGKSIDIDGADSVIFTSKSVDGGPCPVRINGKLVGTSDDEINWHR